MNDAEVYAMELTLRREADELRRQRDEALRELRSMLHVLDGRLQIDTVERIQRARRILAQYDKDGDA
jgi:hypothetical protein